MFLSGYGRKPVNPYGIKHFIFDFGGVMVEKTYILDNIFSILNSDFHTDIPNKENSAYIRKLRRAVGSGRISSREFLESIFNKYISRNNFSKRNNTKYEINYYLEIWFHHYTQLTNFSSEMEEIISQLKSSGYLVSLMSNTFDIHEKSNDLRGFYDIFDHVFLSNKIGFRKPDIEKYKYVLKKLKTTPKKCVFIDDKIVNLIPSAKFGI